MSDITPIALAPSTVALRRRRRWVLVTPAAAAAVIGMTLLAGCSSGSIGNPARPSLPGRPSSSASSRAGLSAEQIMAEAIDAVYAAGSVHSVASDSAGSRSVTFTDDISALAGREVITTNGGGRATFLLVGGVGYLRGNAAALENYYGIPAPVAAQLSGRWISFHQDDQGYQDLTSQLTIPGLVDEISLQAPLALRGSSLVGNQPAVAVQGIVSTATGAPAGTRATLYVASTGRPLPLSFEGAGPGARLRATFSNWGEALQLTPPANSLPASSLAS